MISLMYKCGKCQRYFVLPCKKSREQISHTCVCGNKIKLVDSKVYFRGEQKDLIFKAQQLMELEG